MLGLSSHFKPFPRAFPGEFEDTQKKFWVRDMETGWRMKPHVTFRWFSEDYESSYRSNDQGFRADVDFGTSGSSRKVILAGDSFTFGTGVEYPETFGAMIEARLTDTAVYNLAMPGFGVDQVWLSVRHQGLPLNPDLIIVGINDSDLKRSQTAFRHGEQFNKPTFKLVDGKLIPRTLEDRPNLLVRFLEQESRIWTAGRLIGRFVAYRIPLGEWWFLNRAMFDAIRKDCREAGVPVLFIYIPTKAWREFHTLASYMEHVEAHFIDLRREAEAPPPWMYFPHDGHLTAMGHANVAEKVQEWIRLHMPQ